MQRLVGNRATGRLLDRRQRMERDKLGDTKPQSSKAGKSLPRPLKSGVEALSGISMDHVTVHYNSPHPAQFMALAYTQGSEIHLAPGQESYLPHEAWHAVQQAQGRVQPTRQLKSGVAVNGDRGLEREADVMGAKAQAAHTLDHGATELGPRGITAQSSEQDFHSMPIQGKFKLLDPAHEDSYLYGWAESEEAAVSRESAYQWLGHYPDLGGSEGDLLQNQSDGKYYRTRNMFGDTHPQEWVPKNSSPVDQIVLELAQRAVTAHMTKHEPTPSGEIGRMNFRFPEAQGVLWYVGAPPPNLDAAHHPEVKFIETDVWTLMARSMEYKADSLNKAYIVSQEQAGRYLYVRRPASVVVADEASRRETSKYVYRGGSFDQITPERVTAVKQAATELNGAIGPLLVQQPVTFTAEAKGRPRGEGQVTAMRGMNAAAYALAMGVVGADTTDWEWLHIRGARLGGATTAANLVAGTSSANSAMIPYEHQILELSKLASPEHPFRVIWMVQTRERLGTRILIAWSAPEGLTRPDGYFLRQRDGEINFNPLSGQIADRAVRDLVWEPRFLPPVPLFDAPGSVPAAAGSTPSSMPIPQTGPLGSVSTAVPGVIPHSGFPPPTSMWPSSMPIHPHEPMAPQPTSPGAEPVEKMFRPAPLSVLPPQAEWGSPPQFGFTQPPPMESASSIPQMGTPIRPYEPTAPPQPTPAAAESAATQFHPFPPFVPPAQVGWGSLPPMTMPRGPAASPAPQRFVPPRELIQLIQDKAPPYHQIDYKVLQKVCALSLRLGERVAMYLKMVGY